MLRNLKARPFRPCLEQLEDRAMPSFLLGGAVTQLAAPLQAMVKDMQTAQAHLKSDLISGANAVSNNNLQGARHFFAVAVGDFQQLLTNQHAIKAASSVDQNFVRAAAMAEFQSGDSLDLVILTFGKMIGLDPMKALTDPAAQADNIVQSQDVQGDISFMTQIATVGGIPVIQDVTLPTF
jgi:hypothetical protein